MQTFTDLKIWQKAHEFTLLMYKATASFPSEEKFGLTNQIRRASVSIESNIAEGRGRGSDKDFSRFLSIAIGSCFEVKSQILIAKDLKFISISQADFLESKIDEVSRMIYSFQSKLKA